VPFYKKLRGLSIPVPLRRQFQEISHLHDGHVTEAFRTQQVTVTRNHVIRPCRCGTFEYVVVGGVFNSLRIFRRCDLTRDAVSFGIVLLVATSIRCRGFPGKLNAATEMLESAVTETTLISVLLAGSASRGPTPFPRGCQASGPALCRMRKASHDPSGADTVRRLPGRAHPGSCLPPPDFCHQGFGHSHAAVGQRHTCILGGISPRLASQPGTVQGIFTLGAHGFKRIE
jgi:hypothetical protein